MVECRPSKSDVAGSSPVSHSNEYRKVLKFLGVAQLAERVIWDHEAASSRLATQTIWPVSQAVKTPDLQSGITGSTPVQVTNLIERGTPHDTSGIY